MSELSEEDSWMIVETLIQNLNDLEELKATYNPEVEVDDAIEQNEELLDKLSPNWREASSCSEVETRKITINQES